LSWTPATTQTPGNYTAQFTASDNAACGPGQTTAQVVIQLVQPLALSAQIQQGALQLSFPSAAGETYQVQYSDDLESGNWQVLQEFTGLQTNRVTTLDPTVISAGARFYRVQWLR